MRPPGRATRLLLLIIGLTAPFAALFALILFFPPSTLRPATSTATLPAQASAFSPDTPWSARPATAPLFATADNASLWLLRRFALGPDSQPGFQLLTRSSNAADWHLLRPDGVPYFSGIPLALSSITSPDFANTAFILGSNGQLTAVAADADTSPRDPLPPSHRLLAVGAAPDGLYAVTQGVPDPSTTRPGDRLLLHHLPPPASQATTAPTTASASAPAAASAPATKPIPLINAYWFRGAIWEALPPLGPLSSPNSPSAGAQVAVTASDGRIAVAWVEPAHPRNLLVRSRPAGNPASPWSPTTILSLEEPLPLDSRLQAVTFDNKSCILFAVPTANTFALLGERWSYRPDDSLDAQRLPALLLGPGAAGANPARDIVAAPSESSLIVIVAAAHDDAAPLLTTTFNPDGHRLSPLHDIAPQPHVIGLQLGENIILLIVAALMILSLWRWKNHPREANVPFGKQSAGLPLRAAAFLIDFTAAFLLIVTLFGLWDHYAWLDLLATWADALTRPQNLFSSPPILWILALYTSHVALAELFFRKSLGKALLGLEVLMVDGKAPTVAAILIRNLVRLAEISAAGLPLFYMCISKYRQRPGDVLAQTLVVKDQPPTPV